MEVLKFIAAISLVAIIVCFAILTISLVVFIIQLAIDEWRWERRRKK